MAAAFAWGKYDSSDGAESPRVSGSLGKPQSRASTEVLWVLSLASVWERHHTCLNARNFKTYDIFTVTAQLRLLQVSF